MSMDDEDNSMLAMLLNEAMRTSALLREFLEFRLERLRLDDCYEKMHLEEEQMHAEQYGEDEAVATYWSEFVYDWL